MKREKTYFELATMKDLKEVANIYTAIHEDLEKSINYPKWPKGIYPTLDSAQEALEKQELYILKTDQKIIGTVILNHDQDDGYETANWLIDAKDNQVLVIHTLAIDPSMKGYGYAGQMIQHIQSLAISTHCLAIRLDLTENNIPARCLYQKHGFYFTGIADLHRQTAGIQYSEMYEYNLQIPHN